jgi:hypothetical protein
MLCCTINIMAKRREKQCVLSTLSFGPSDNGPFAVWFLPAKHLRYSGT